jgi:hypothetical protein
MADYGICENCLRRNGSVCTTYGGYDISDNAYFVCTFKSVRVPPDTAAKTAEANARGEGYKADEDKPDWSLLPLDVLEDTVRVLTVGAKKYARDNWQKVPNARERYFAAALRHLTAWQRGEMNDPETGRPHLAHAQCCLTFLGWLDKHGDKP